MSTGWTWWWVAVAGAWPLLADAQVQVLGNREPLCVFAGEACNVSVTFANPGNEPFQADVQTRMFQASSATAAPLGGGPWKKLQVLPRQTVVDAAPLSFPAVNAATKFLVQWVAGTNDLLGITEVWVYPTNLLWELKPMTDERGPGLFDPRNQLKPLLKNLKVHFTDLEGGGLDDFAGKLAIIGPFDSAAQLWPELPGQIKALAKRDVAVVWLLPPAEKTDAPAPSFYTIMAGTNAVVVAQASLVPRLPDNPRAQLNLLCLCKQALKPEPLQWPVLPIKP